MTSTGGVGERLALVAGGALALALVQLLLAKREGKSRDGGNLGTGSAHSINTPEVRLTNTRWFSQLFLSTTGCAIGLGSCRDYEL